MGAKNPDFLLAEIHAANPGFESLIHEEKGSFMLSLFVEKVMGDINNNRSRFIYKIFDEIQDALESRQQLRCIYSNDARYISLKKNI